MPLQDPGLVIAPAELQQRQAEVLDGVEVPHPEKVLLERADETLSAAIALRRAHKGWRADHTQKRDLALKGIRDILAAVIMPKRQAASDALPEAPEALARTLPDRLQRLKAGGAPGRMDADALGRAVVDGNEYTRETFTCHDAGQVGAPHRVDPLGRDRAVMAPGPPGSTSALGRQQPVLAHQSQHPPARGAKAGKAQPGPHLAIALAMKGAGRQHPSDGRHEIIVRHRANRSRTARRCWRDMPVTIEGGTRHAPDPGNAGQAIRASTCGRGLAAHGLDLLRAKGRPPSSSSILRCSSSRSSRTSPSLALSCSLWRSCPSLGRLARAASPPTRKSSRQLESVAAVTPSSRETSSRSSPLSSRRTALSLRCRLMRPPRPSPGASLMISVMFTSSRVVPLKRCLIQP